MAPRVYVTSDGVRLTVKPVPALLVQDAQRALKKPKPPMWHNEQKNRDEPNPNHPDYLSEVAEYEEKLSDRATDTLLLRGLAVMEPLPDDVLPINSDGWIEELEYLGIEVPTNGFGRRLAWLKYYILSNNDDLLNVTKEIGVAGGIVTEEAVDKAIDSFRSGTSGPTLVEVPATE